MAKHLGLHDAKPVAVNPPGPDDVAAVVLDPSMTIKQTAWRPSVSFEQTITNVLIWYDRHGVTDVYSHLQENT